MQRNTSGLRSTLGRAASCSRVIQAVRTMTRSSRLVASGPATEPVKATLRQGLGNQRIGSFLQGLAHHCLDQAFASLEVASRLVDDDAARGALLDDEETAVALDDCRHRDVGSKSHGRIIAAGRAGARYWMTRGQRCCWRVSACGALAVQASSKKFR
jgi:hypothetical protein